MHQKRTHNYLAPVTVKIGMQKHVFDYGAYHHIWLNTNEDEMTVLTNPSNNVRVEFWTGYHPGQGR